MHSILNRNIYFVKEQVGMFKASNNYDIFDPETKEQILTCREEKLGIFTKLLRFTEYKRMTPFHVEIKTTTGQPVLEVTRGISLFLSKVTVLDEHSGAVGYFKQKFYSIGGKFDVLDMDENVVCTLQGKWSGWDFKFVKDGVELAQVSKKWAGLGKEMFTSADNYVLSIDNSVPKNSSLRTLILAAVMCIDMVLKE